MEKPLHPYRGYYYGSDLRIKFIIRLFFLLIIFSLTFLVCIQKATAQTLPSGFSQVMVANGISNPTAMAFAPDGRIFVAQQSGQLRVIKNGTLLSQPFISLSVNSSGERGLLGIAFDPNFNSNNYIYLYYTLSSAANNRISRFTANGDVAVSGSEQVILNLSPLSSATNHNGGHMQFGPDGKLYVGIGDNGEAVYAQTFDSYHGKILRINPDGSVPPGNPFTSGSAQQQRVWSYGVRNPFTIAFQPGTGKLFVNDVGGNTWEEINDATAGGKNFGWPYSEGGGSSYSNPLYAYGHGSSGGTGCAITGGTFFNPSSTNYPSTYTGRYFYIDFCSNWIDMLTLSGGSATRSNFASNIAGSPVSLITGTDGNLYFLSRDNSAVYKITYAGSSAPVITNQPQSVTVAQGNTATFYVSVTGSTPLSYQWRKNGANISGASSSSYSISSVTTASAGTYSVVVSNASGSVTSNNATLTVTSPNQAPSASITTPAAGTTYAGGNTISFSGTATDPENGNLATSAYNWYVLFYHGTHNHPGPSVTKNGTGGSFNIPTTGETATDVFYRLYLVVTDPQGATDTVYRDIMPRTSTITLNTNPQGLDITLDGQPFKAPLTVTSVEGVIRSIGTTSPQSLNGSTYNYSNWAHGGSQTQTISTPVNNTSYTANFAVSALPAITSQPQSITVAPGSSATFSVTASGAAPLSYQWKKNGTNISGATSSSYTIASVTTASAGNFSVAVSNSSGTVTSNNATLTVTSSGGGTSYNIFQPTGVPNSPRSNDGQGIALGVKFRSTQNGFINGVRYYKGAGTTGTHIGQLWSSTGTMLAQATFTNETASGWQQALFSNPVAITAGVTYVASYHSPSGDFAATSSYFTQATINGPLRGLADGEDGVNGLYKYSATPVFPNNGYQSSNYWADVIFTTSSGGDATAPTVSSVTPLNGSTGIVVNTTVTATFSEAVNSSTVTGTTVQLKNAAGTIIPSSVTTSSNKITLTPASALANSTSYTATIKAGTSGVKDLAGNALANDYTWSFVTVAAGGSGSSTTTIFQPSAVPANPTNNDGQGIELGVRFRSTQNGYITGLRYYKGPGTTGTHIGHLWTNTGGLLATATFTNETTSGWQQALFSSPVAITAGVTYVASQFSPSGHYASTVNYFTQAVVNGPLRGLADGEDGINGLYKYSSSSAFPTFGHKSSNYWIDVVFSTGSASRGTATSSQVTGNVEQVADPLLKELVVSISPNPTTSHFNLVIGGDINAPVSVRVLDAYGKVVEKYERTVSGQTLRVGQQLNAGIYFAEVIQGSQRKIVKIVKAN
jgi:glucose/arabinose dehydrogenase